MPRYNPFNSLDNDSCIFCSLSPTFVVDITGFVGGESAGTDSLYSPPTATTGTTPTSAAGAYTISMTGGSVRNYSFEVTDTGTLTIEKAAGPPAPSEQIVGKFPSASTSIELTGLPRVQVVWKQRWR